MGFNVLYCLLLFIMPCNMYLALVYKLSHVAESVLYLLFVCSYSSVSCPASVNAEN